MAQGIDIETDDMAQLVERSHGGDPVAQGRLADSIRGLVQASARRAVQDPHDVEDLSQNIFLAVFRGLRTFRGESHFRTWLVTVARNEGRKFLRTRMRRDDPVRDADREPDALAAPWQDRMEAKRMARALQQLPDAERHALERVVFDGLSYAEAAHALGCSAGAVRGRVYRARRELRRHLQGEESKD